ncbi:TPA: amino acid kinase [Methanosarcinaceae archaeon]|nr:amino acid kinase [Methanosarcinaceae archaeon]
MRVVVKLGGSLIREAPGIIDRLVEEFAPGGFAQEKETFGKVASEKVASGKEENNREKEASVRGRSGEDSSETCPECILIVPGGGIFADAVREADRTFGLGADASHWMAVLGMEQYACCLLDKSRAAATYSIKSPDPGVSILFPYGLLKTKDPLPHSWDVTSDTIAAWVAQQTGACFVKVTDVDGVFLKGELVKEISAPDLAAAGTSCTGTSCTDRALPEFLLKNRMDCMIVNGKYPERVLQAVYGRPVLGTGVKGNI